MAKLFDPFILHVFVVLAAGLLLMNVVVSAPADEAQQATGAAAAAVAGVGTVVGVDVTVNNDIAASAEDEEDDDEDGEEGKDLGNKHCSCPPNTGGVILPEVQNRASNFAIDGTLLTANGSTPLESCSNCGKTNFNSGGNGCGGGKKVTLQKFCYPDIGEKVGSSALGSDNVWILCDNRPARKNLCVCAFDKESGGEGRCALVSKRSDFRGVGGRAIVRCHDDGCWAYWVNFKNQELAYHQRTFKGDRNTVEELTPNNPYFLSGKIIAISCSGCDAIRRPRCVGTPHTPEPPIPVTPPPPPCHKMITEDENGQDCCGPCTAGLIGISYNERSFAIDGGSLTTDSNGIPPKKICKKCSLKDERVSGCYAAQGADRGSQYLGSSFFAMCNKPEKLCVCALKKNGDFVEDRHKSCYKTFDKASWGGAAAVVTTQCKVDGYCENFFMPAGTMTISNGERTFRSNENLLSFETEHYLHAQKLILSCKGCEEIRNKLVCSAHAEAV